MLQPDLFFAYGLSSGLAVVSGKKLKDESSPVVNKYFLGAVLWLSVLYVPQVMYLLFRFPAWEGMYVATSLSDYPPWFIPVYFIAVMALGVVGFQVTAYFVRGGKMGAALAQVIWSMAVATLIVSVGWDGKGYARTMYAGDGADWAAGVSYPLVEFFSSPMFYTLLWLEALVLIPYAIMLIRWGRESGLVGTKA